MKRTPGNINAIAAAIRLAYPTTTAESQRSMPFMMCWFMLATNYSTLAAVVRYQ
jgi:hypothetical protein